MPAACILRHGMLIARHIVPALCLVRMALILRKTRTSRGVARHRPQTTGLIHSEQIHGPTMPSKNVHLRDHVPVEETAMALAGQKAVMDVLLITIVSINQLLEMLWRCILQELRRKRQTKAALGVPMVRLARRIPTG